MPLFMIEAVNHIYREIEADTEAEAREAFIDLEEYDDITKVIQYKGPTPGVVNEQEIAIAQEEYDEKNRINTYMGKISKANPMYTSRDMQNIRRAFTDGMNLVKEDK